MHFLHPIPEPQVTKPELLQENKNDIVGNKTLHCGKLMDMFKKFYKEHGQNEPRCELLCNWNTNNCQKWGLSWRLRLKCDNCNFCGEKTKVYTEAWNYLHVAVLNLDVKYKHKFLSDINETHDNFLDSVEYNVCESCILVYVHALVQNVSVLAIEHQ